MNEEQFYKFLDWWYPQAVGNLRSSQPRPVGNWKRNGWYGQCFAEADQDGNGWVCSGGENVNSLSFHSTSCNISLWLPKGPTPFISAEKRQF